MKTYNIADLVRAGDDEKLIEAAEHILDHWRDHRPSHVTSAVMVVRMTHPAQNMSEGLIKQLMLAVGPEEAPVPKISI